MPRCVLGSLIFSAPCLLLSLAACATSQATPGETCDGSNIKKPACYNGFGFNVTSALGGSSLLQAKRSTSRMKATEWLSDAEMHATALHMSDYLQKLASRSASPTRELFQSFRICGKCEEFERFGEANDGGYLTCMDGLQDTVRAAYSMGVASYDKWSKDVAAKFGVPVNQFDCTVNTGTGCDNCTFFKKCMVSDDNHEKSPFPPEQQWTLHDALANTGQGDAPKGSLLMKMDIEASEWPLYEAAAPDILARFKEIIIEFHGLDNVPKHQQYLSAMQHILNAGFQVTHLHGNNAAGMVELEGDRIPGILEVTFVLEAANRGECMNSQEYLPLDHVNLPARSELPMAKLD